MKLTLHNAKIVQHYRSLDDREVLMQRLESERITSENTKTLMTE
jgi:hypothetical protein